MFNKCQQSNIILENNPLVPCKTAILLMRFYLKLGKIGLKDSLATIDHPSRHFPGQSWQ